VSTKPRRIPPGPDQESVWDYPRPPRVEEVSEPVKIVFSGEVIAETTRAKRVLETSHPPTYYLPPEDVREEYLTRTDRTSFCEWKGAARYYHVAVEGNQAPHAAWSYPDPSPGFDSIRDHLAFYAGPMEACYVGEEQVAPQPGGFYGGWITSRVVGPFKGKPGTAGW
jgi:uncharacterized protein (DUF427 family)